MRLLNLYLAPISKSEWSHGYADKGPKFYTVRVDIRGVRLSVYSKFARWWGIQPWRVDSSYIEPASYGVPYGK